MATAIVVAIFIFIYKNDILDIDESKLPSVFSVFTKPI